MLEGRGAGDLHGGEDDSNIDPALFANMVCFLVYGLVLLDLYFTIRWF